MYRVVAVLIMLLFADAAAKDKGGDFTACAKGQVELAKKAADYHGDERIKRLIQADLSRAAKEEAEGDADECLEALDHASKLIAGQF